MGSQFLIFKVLKVVFPKSFKMTTADVSPVKKVVKAKTPAAHPTYSVMITDTIKALKDRTGSSRQAILKYICANYKVDAAKAAVHVRTALKKGVAAETLKMAAAAGKKGAGCYKLGEKAKEVKKPKVAKVKKPVVKKPKAAKKPAAKKAEGGKVAEKKTAAKKPAAKKAIKQPAAAKKSPTKKPASKKPAAKKPVSAKTSPKKTAAKKPAAKKATPKKPAAQKPAAAKKPATKKPAKK